MTINVDPQTVGPVTIFMGEMFSDLDMTGVPVQYQSFFGRDGIGNTDFVNNSLQYSADFVRGESTISKMLTRQTGASWDLGDQTNSSKGQRFKNRTRVFPIMTEYMHVGFDDLFNRVAGELQQFDSGSDDVGVLVNRLRVRFAEQMKAAIKKLMRRNELAASESLRVGTQTLDDGAVYSWDRSTTNSFAAALVWTNAAALIIEEIDELCDEIQQNGKVEPNFVNPGVDVWTAMVKQLAFQNLSDNRGYTIVRVGQKNVDLPELDADVAWMVGAGFKHVGFIETYKGRKLPVLINNEKYQDSAKAWQPYMPVDEFFAGYSGARCDRAFGPRITFPNNPTHDQAMNALLGFDFATAQMPNNIANPGVFDPRMFHIDGKVNADNDALAARMVTGPLLITNQTDSFGRITGVV